MKKEEEYRIKYKYDMMNVIIHDLHRLLDSLSGAIYNLDHNIKKRNLKSDIKIIYQVDYIKSIKSQIQELLQLYQGERRHNTEFINFSKVLSQVVQVFGKYGITFEEYKSERKVKTDRKILSLILYSFFCIFRSY